MLNYAQVLGLQLLLYAAKQMKPRLCWCGQPPRLCQGLASGY